MKALHVALLRDHHCYKSIQTDVYFYQANPLVEVDSHYPAHMRKG